MPWLGSVRLLLAREDAAIECVGVDDQLVTQYLSPHRGYKILAASGSVVAAVSSDRQRLILWHTWDGRRPFAELHLTSQTRTGWRILISRKRKRSSAAMVRRWGVRGSGRDMLRFQALSRQPRLDLLVIDLHRLRWLVGLPASDGDQLRGDADRDLLHRHRAMS